MNRLMPLTFFILLAACSPVNLTPFSTRTPEITLTPSPTIDWFPVTETPTNVPTTEPSPTPNLRPGVGSIVLRDDFEEGEVWSQVTTTNSSVTVISDRLTLALSRPSSFLFTLRNKPVFTDFYAEITAEPSLCTGADEYGLLVRATTTQNFYRFSLSCDGRGRVNRLSKDKVGSIIPWTANGAIPSGMLSTSRLGVWALKDEIRFFINDYFLFSIRDTIYYHGMLGVFVRAAGETPVTVSYSDLVVRQVQEVDDGG